MKFALIFPVLFIAVMQSISARKGTTRRSRNSGGLPLNGARQKAYPVLLSIVREGGFRGLKECKKQFKNEIWNCSLDQSKQDVFSHLPIFVKTTLPYATRETALLHAISNAAITHEVTLQCRQNKIPGCHCVEKNKQNGGNGEWQWGGCGDNIWFGENTTKSFIDVLEPQEESARRAVNLHNNEIGRRVVRLSLKKECKCHGVTGSCEYKTCWRSLAPFDEVGQQLKLKYRHAVRVSLVKGILKEVKTKKIAARRDKKLVYLDNSPDFCVRNVTAGSLGVLGRTCSSEDGGVDKCVSLCDSCRLRSRTVEHSKQVPCRCKFVWCCSIQCKE